MSSHMGCRLGVLQKTRQGALTNQKRLARGGVGNQGRGTAKLAGVDTKGGIAQKMAGHI